MSAHSRAMTHDYIINANLESKHEEGAFNVDVNVEGRLKLGG